MGIGLFGGSFDPIHMGHLRIAEEVREQFSLEAIYFVPAWLQPLKRLATAAGADDRTRMIEMATRDNNYFHTSRAEIRRQGISYTIDTVKLFARTFDEIYFLVGLDAFADIGLWKGFQELFFYANFIVMARPGRTVEGLPDSLKEQVSVVDGTTWKHASGKRIFLHHITQLDISSTRIRELLRSRRSVKYLVPLAVERYIEKKGLYTN